MRVRLGMALALALAPVLLLSAIQAGLSFGREAAARRAELAAAAQSSTATAQARVLSAEVLLQTLAPYSVGLECAQRLAQVSARIGGYANLIRFAPDGQVECAAATTPADPVRARRPWFRALAGGASVTVTAAAGADYADRPAVLAAVRAADDEGRFAGALAAVIPLDSLRPRSPQGGAARFEVALVDGRGAVLTSTDPNAFPSAARDRFHDPGAAPDSLWFSHDRLGRPTVLSSAPLLGHGMFVVLSAPAQNLASWAALNALSVIGLPLITFGAALAAVLVVAEYAVVRWIGYLQRIAQIYGRGRFSVHPRKAAAAPPEIRDLAQTLDEMAQAISERDATLRDTLAQKDDLMREIHHRVKNNLQVISSLVSLQERALADPGGRAAMLDTRQRIAALALVYRSLYQGADLKRVDLSEFLDELIGQLLLVEPPRGGPVETKLAIEPLIIDPDKLAPLALFAVEAITNAKKHALDAAGGRLCVGLHLRGGTAELTIADSGLAGQPRARAPVVRGGVGHTLMAAFARQLRGRVVFAANAQGGLTARLTFPAGEAAGTSA